MLLSIDLSGFCLTLAKLSLYSRLTTGQYHNIVLTTGKYHDIALTTIQYYIYALWRYFDLRHKWATRQYTITMQGQESIQYNTQGMLFNELLSSSVFVNSIPYSGKFSQVQIFAKIPFPLQKKVSRF